MPRWWFAARSCGSRHLLAAARRYRPKARQLHRTRNATGLFKEVNSAKTPAPFRGKQSHTAAPSLETRIPEGILAVGSAEVPPAPQLLPRQVRCCHPGTAWCMAATHPLRRLLHPSINVLCCFAFGGDLNVCVQKKLLTEALVINVQKISILSFRFRAGNRRRFSVSKPKLGIETHRFAILNPTRLREN